MSRDRLSLRKSVVANFDLWEAQARVGNIDQAFAYLKAANRLRKTELTFDIEEDRALFDRIKGAFQRHISDVDTGASRPGITPVFVLGMPRSGTTLVEQILASHSRVRAAGELTLLADCIEQMDRPSPSFDQDQLEKLRNDYLSGLSALSGGKKFVTDKMPLNFRWIGFILSALPEAKIIYVKRDPCATCFSIFKTLFSLDGNQFAYDLQDVSRYYNLHMDLMRFWRKRFPNKFYHLNYERLTENQTSETRRLLEYVGLNWEDRCLTFYNTERHIATASALQVRRKMYRNSSNAWRVYAAYLGPMLAIIKMADTPHKYSAPTSSGR